MLVPVTALMMASCSQTDDMQKKICGTWETYSSTTYSRESGEVTHPEAPFDEKFKWMLIIKDNNSITVPAPDEYSEEVSTTYKLYLSSEALEKELIRKSHLRKAAGYKKDGNEDPYILITDEKIVGEKKFQIVRCTKDTLVIRYLSDDFLLSGVLENKFVRR